MSFFTYQNSAIRYDCYGRGAPLLFMHGLAADRHQALATLAGLSGHRIIVVDMPGHGESAGSGCGFTYYADIALALMAHLSIDTVCLGGISMGAGIALCASQRAPQRVSGLLLVRPAWLAEPASPHLDIIARIGRWLARGPEYARCRLESDPEFIRIVANNPGAASSIHGALTRAQAVSSARILPAMVADRPINTIDILATLPHPALVIGNEDDPLHPVALARTLATLLPGARYHQVPSRYLAPKAHSQALLTQIQAFLA